MFSIHYHLIYFVGDKVAADHFKDEIIPLLKANDRLKYAQYVAMNHMKDTGKT